MPANAYPHLVFATDSQTLPRERLQGIVDELFAGRDPAATVEQGSLQVVVRLGDYPLTFWYDDESDGLGERYAGFAPTLKRRRISRCSTMIDASGDADPDGTLAGDVAALMSAIAGQPGVYVFSEEAKAFVGLDEADPFATPAPEAAPAPAPVAAPEPVPTPVAPVAPEPVAEAPVAEAPAAEAPVADEPVVEPVLVEPVIVEPVIVEEPVALEPVIAPEPVRDAEPAAAAPFEMPDLDNPVAEPAFEPGTQDRAQAPGRTEPTDPLAEPVAEQPIVEEPIVEEPVVEEPVVEQPAASESAPAPEETREAVPQDPAQGAPEPQPAPEPAAPPVHEPAAEAEQPREQGFFKRIFGRRR